MSTRQHLSLIFVEPHADCWGFSCSSIASVGPTEYAAPVLRNKSDLTTICPIDLFIVFAIMPMNRKTGGRVSVSKLGIKIVKRAAAAG